MHFSTLQQARTSNLGAHGGPIMSFMTCHFHKLLLLPVCWKLVGMPLAPGLPEGQDEGLQDRGRRAGEEGAQQTEESSADQQRKNGEYGIEADGMAKDARRQDLAVQSCLHDGDKDAVDERRLPAMRKGKANADRPRDVGADLWDELTDEDDQRQQEDIGHADDEGSKPNDDHHDRGQQDLAAHKTAQ